MEVINLNLIPTGALPVVHASQYDEGRRFRANLMDGSVVYTLDGTETLECDVKKPDGNIVTVAVTNTSDSYVEIDTTLQMCACAGDSLAELHITKGAQEIGTLNFILAVERSPLEGGIESESEIDNLATQVAGLVASEVENQYDSGNVIFDNEPTEGHGNGYTVTSEGIRNAIDNALNMTDTASGAIATFDTSLALPLQDCTIDINAVQEGSGTPSPSNPRAISGFDSGVITRCGKNLYQSGSVTEEFNGAFWSLGGTVYSNVPDGSLVLNAGTYTLSNFPTKEIRRFDETGARVGTSIGTMTFTLTKREKVRFAIITESQNYNVQIEVGDTATTYEAYNGNRYTDDFGQTVYGGTLDVTSGKLVVTFAKKKINELIWSYANISGAERFYSSSLYREIERPASLDIVSTLKCSCYETVSQRQYAQFTSDNIIAVQAQGDIVIRDTNLTSVEALLNAVGDQEICYPLATPVTYQLTPTQISAIVGTNNVFTDTNGDTSLEYYTKRGEQTVRIAEGVAVDVINNKNIDNLTTTNKTLVGAVNEVNNRLGNRLVGAWTADSSTSNLQILTEDIEVTAGTYLIIMSYPDTSANFVACLYNRATSGVYDNCYISGGSWTSKAIVTAFSGNGKLCIASAQGSSVTFSNKIRGSIRAIKLSNLY